MQVPVPTVTAAIFFLMLVGCVDRPVSDTDRDLVLTVDDLQAYGLVLPNDFDSYETMTRKRWFDGTVVVEYEFQAPATLQLPYVYSAAQQYLSEKDACASLSADQLGIAVAGVELDERNDIFTAGTESEFAFLLHDGTPSGNYFSMCRGNNTFMVMLGGMHFDDAEVWNQLIGKNLLALERFE